MTKHYRHRHGIFHHDVAGPSADAAPRTPLGRRFSALLASTGLANLAEGLLAAFVPLVAVSLTRSPTLISLLSAAAWLPWLLLGAFAGVITDRSDRRQVQVWSLRARTLVLLVVTLAAIAGWLTMTVLVVLAFLLGVTAVFADIAAGAMIPDLVARDQLARANGRLLGVQQVADSFLGAPLAGLLVLVGAAAGFGTAAALAAGASVLLQVGVRGTFPGAPSHDAGVLAQLREGIAVATGNRIIGSLMISGSLINMAMSAYFAVFVLWVVGPGSAMGLTASQYPLLTMCLAVGAVLGSVLAAPTRARLSDLTTIVVGCSGVGLLVVPVIWPSAWIAGATIAVVGAMTTAGSVVSMSVRQQIVPRHLLGRVGGVGRTLTFGLMPLGALAGGVIAEHFGLRVTFFGAIALALASCGYLAVRVRPSQVRDALAGAAPGEPAAEPGHVPQAGTGLVTVSPSASSEATSA